MHLLKELGILYDALMYISGHFFPESMKPAPDLPDISVEIPPIIMPFFYRNPKSDETPVLAWLAEHSNVTSVEDFSYLLDEDEETESLRNLVFSALFPGEAPAESICSVRTAEKLDLMGYAPDFKYRAHICLTYFSHAVRELCRTLTSLEKPISNLHEAYKGETDALFSAISSGKYNRLYESTRKVSMDSFGKITVSFSILRPCLSSMYSEGDNLRLLLGIDHIPALIEELDEDKVDLNAFLDHIGSQPRRVILSTLAENGEMTVSDVSRQTGIPLSTVLRHMEALSDDYLIKVSSKKGLQIFYSINRNFLEKASRKTYDYLKSLFSGGDIIEGNKK